MSDEGTTDSRADEASRVPSGLAVVVVLYLEQLDLAVAGEPHVPGRQLPRYRHYGWLEYGNRVGIFRIIDLLDRCGIKVTVAANSLACQSYPRLVEMFLERGYEFCAHGRAVNDPHRDLAGMRNCASTIEGSTGGRVTGWISQDFMQLAETVPLARDAGLAYVADFASADMPFQLHGCEEVVCFPNSYELDDVRIFYDRRVNAWHYPDMIFEAFATLVREAVESPKVMCIPIHPWVLGAPHRFKYLSAALSRIVAAGGYWNGTAGDVAGRYREAWAAGQLTPKVLRFT